MIAGTLPIGLTARNSGFRCSPAFMLTTRSSCGAPSSSSRMRVPDERVLGEWKKTMVSLAMVPPRGFRHHAVAEKCDRGMIRGASILDPEEAQHGSVAPLDAARERGERGLEARLGAVQLPGALVVPQEAPAVALALAEVNDDVAAQIDRLGDRHQVAQRHAVLGAEIRL